MPERRIVAQTKKRILPARHKAWAIAKLAVVAWLLVYAIATPPATTAVLGAFVWTWVGIAAAGILASIVGMLLAQRLGRSRQGRLVELSGLIVGAVGPFIHATTLGWLVVAGLTSGDPEATNRLGPMLQSVAIACFLMVRFVEVRTRAEVLV